MSKTDFDIGAIRDWLSSGEFRDVLADYASKGAAASRASRDFRDRTGALRASVSSSTELHSDGYHGYITASPVSNFVSNEKGLTANVKPVIKGVYDRTGTFRHAASPLFIESGLWLSEGEV